MCLRLLYYLIINNKLLNKHTFAIEHQGLRNKSLVLIEELFYSYWNTSKTVGHNFFLHVFLIEFIFINSL